MNTKGILFSNAPRLALLAALIRGMTRACLDPIRAQRGLLGKLLDEGALPTDDGDAPQAALPAYLRGRVRVLPCPIWGALLPFVPPIISDEAVADALAAAAQGAPPALPARIGTQRRELPIV